MQTESISQTEFRDAVATNPKAPRWVAMILAAAAGKCTRMTFADEKSKRMASVLLAEARRRHDLKDKVQIVRRGLVICVGPRAEVV